MFHANEDTIKERNIRKWKYIGLFRDVRRVQESIGLINRVSVKGGMILFAKPSLQNILFTARLRLPFMNSSFNRPF